MCSGDNGALSYVLYFEFEVLLLLTVTDICYKTAEWLLLDVGYRI